MRDDQKVAYLWFNGWTFQGFRGGSQPALHGG